MAQPHQLFFWLLVSPLSRINSATFLGHHFHPSTFLWISQSLISSPASNTFLIFSINILYNRSSVRSISIHSDSIVPKILTAFWHHIEQMCQCFFHTSPPQLGRRLQKHLQRGFGAQNQHGTTCSLLLRGFIYCVSLVLKTNLPWERPFFVSAHWESEKWQQGVHPKPTHFRFWCQLKATWSPHWCSTLSTVVWGGSLSNEPKQCQLTSVPWGYPAVSKKL